MKLIPPLVFLNIFLLAFWLNGSYKNSVKSLVPTTSYSEINDLKDKNLSFDELKKYFTVLAEKKGAKYALDLLKIAPIPPNTDMHLLGHVVGDVLYRQLGLEGIKICTDDFRNACSHSIVVGLLIDKGEGVLPEIAKACRQAPGGSGAYTMCYHGLGHGVLAYTGYDFEKSVALCQKTGTSEYGYQESSQCMGGMVMEIISGGGHDQKTWARKRLIYLKASDPFYPCSDLVPDQAKGLCYTYITPYLWEAVGADLGNPKEADFEKAFALCHQMPQPDNLYKNTCFGGFGKEFVVLAQNRDIRKIEDMTDGQLKTVYSWCQLAEDKEGTQACLGQALGSLYWGGENNPEVSIRFCNIISDSTYQKSCFLNLISSVKSYISDSSYRKQFCSEIPNDFKGECTSLLIN